MLECVPVGGEGISKTDLEAALGADTVKVRTYWTCANCAARSCLALTSVKCPMLKLLFNVLATMHRPKRRGHRLLHTT